MATRPLPEAAGSRYAPYIAELHEFFVTSGIPFGAPEDISAVAARLNEPGFFADDLASLVRSIVLREGGAMPHAQLLEILSLAIAGPELAHAPQQYSEPLRQLLAFLSGVMRRPWNVPASEPAEVVPFPADTSTRTSESAAAEPVTSEPIAFEPRPAVFEKIRGEQIRNRQAEPLLRTVAMPDPERPASDTQEKMHPRAAWGIGASQRRLTPVQRNFLLGAGVIMALAAVLTFLLRPTPPAEVFQVGPAYTRAASPGARPGPSAGAVASNAPTPSPVGPQVTSASPAFIQGKPSPYGESAQPQLNRRTQAAYSQPALGQTAQPATNPQPIATADSSSAVGRTTADPSPVAPETSEASAVPAVPRSSHRESDRIIVGDLSTGRPRPVASGQTSYFTVSSGVMAAYLLFSPDPQYPKLARLAHIQGQVILQAVVGKDGSVSTVRVLRGNRLLRRAAQEAVRRWRYRPYHLGGKPIDVATIVTVDFHDRK